MQGKGPKGQNFLGLLFTKGSRRSVCRLIQIVIERLFFGSGAQFAPCPAFDLAHALTRQPKLTPNRRQALGRPIEAKARSEDGSLTRLKEIQEGMDFVDHRGMKVDLFAGW